MRSTTNEALFSEELKFYQDNKSCMPDPRQQDRKLNKDELVTYRYSVVKRGEVWRYVTMVTKFLDDNN